MKTKLIGVICSLLLSTAHGAAHSVLVLEDSGVVQFVDKICTGNKEHIAFNKEMKVCYDAEYENMHVMVFSRIYTLQGTFFGFSEPRLFDYENGIEDAARDLVKNLRVRFARGIYSEDRFLFKSPVRLAYQPYETTYTEKVVPRYHLATIYENIVARCKEIFRKPGQRRFIPQPDQTLTLTFPKPITPLAPVKTP